MTPSVLLLNVEGLFFGGIAYRFFVVVFALCRFVPVIFIYFFND